MQIIFRKNLKITKFAGEHFFRFLLVITLITLLAACQANDPPETAPPTLVPDRTAAPTATSGQLSTAAVAGTPTRAPGKTVIPARTATTAATIAPSPGAGMVSVSPGRVVAPILMYHHISDKGGSRYTVPVQTFRDQLQYLHDEGYQTVTISRLVDAIRDGGSLPEKPVVITFDDGYQSAVGLGILVTHTTNQLYYLSRREVYRSMPLFGFRRLLVPGEEEQAANNLFTQTPASIE